MVFGSFTERAKVNMHAMILFFWGQKFHQLTNLFLKNRNILFFWIFVVIKFLFN
jgi:hypothetical protein